MLQENIRWKALAEIYTPLHRSPTVAQPQPAARQPRSPGRRAARLGRDRPGQRRDDVRPGFGLPVGIDLCLF